MPELPRVDFGGIRSILSSPELPAEAVDDLLTGVKRRYQEPWRFHHVVRHLEELFGLLAAHRDYLRSPRLVGWAMLYHDVIYDPLAKPPQNEELSARLAAAELAPVLSQPVVQRIAAYIRITGGHQPDTEDSDLDFFLDADLAILGAPADRCDEYAGAIRREYAHVPEEAYRLGRVAVLRGLSTRVDHSSLFKTQLFRNTYEAAAQENIAREVQALSFPA